MRSPRHGATVLCVIADDKPGLLSLISAALSRTGIDTLAAEAYSRARADGKAEAFDSFWVRRAGGGPRAGTIDDRDLAEATRFLADLLAGRADLTSLAPGEFAVNTRRSGAPPPRKTQVSYAQDDVEGMAVLVVEAADRPGLLFAVTRALFAEQASICRCEVSTACGEAFDSFYLTGVGGVPLSLRERKRIETAVRTALEPPPVIPASARPPRTA